MAKYNEPYALKAKLLAWSELNINEVDTIIAIFRSKSLADIYSFLQNLFYFNSNDPKDRILLDLHYYAIKYALDNNFSKIQISSFISIIRAIHRANQETAFENNQFLVKYFYELIICHSIKRPPFCLEIFGSQVAAKVVNYIQSHYLRHYKSYKYVFTPIIGLDLKVEYPNRTPTPNDNASQKSSITRRIESAENSKISQVPELKKQKGDENKVSLSHQVLVNNNDHQDLSLRSQEMREFVRQMLKEHIEESRLKENYLKLELDSKSRVHSAIIKKK